MQFSAISAAFILVALSTRGSATDSSDINPWYTCENYNLVNPVLYASCRKDNGSYNDTNINLDKCLTNNDGVLYCVKK